MPKKKKDLEKVLPALAALAGGAARGIAGGAIRSGIASAASGIGGDDSDSPIQQSVKKIHKAEPELHPDVNDAMRRLGTLPKAGGGPTASDMAEEYGFDTSKPMAQPKVNAAGEELIDGFTPAEWKSFGMKPPSQGGGEIPKDTAKSHSIEQSLLKLMKGHFPGTPLDDDDWKKLNELKQKEERFGEEHQPSIPTTNGDTSKITKGGSFPERGSRQQVENRGNLPSMGSPWGARENKARQEAAQQKLIEGLLSRRQSKSVEKTDAEIDVAPDIKFRPAPKTHPEYDRIPTEEDPRTYSSPSDVSTPEADPYEQRQEREDVIRDSSSRGGRKGGTRGVRSGFSEEVPDYSRHRSGPPETRKRSYITSAIENSLLKIMKGELIEKVDVRTMARGVLGGLRGETQSPYQAGQTRPMGEAHKQASIIPFSGRGEEQSPQYERGHGVGAAARELSGIDEAKYMAGQAKVGWDWGQQEKPGQMSAATMREQGELPGAAARIGEVAGRAYGSLRPKSMEKVDFSDTKPEGDIKHPIDMPNGDKVFQKPIQIRRREPSERTGDPNIKITRRTPSERTGGPNPVNLNFPRTIEESLLKLMKGEDPRQGRFQMFPPEEPKDDMGKPQDTEVRQGKLPMSEAEERNLGNPDAPFKEGWKTGKTARQARNVGRPMSGDPSRDFTPDIAHIPSKQLNERMREKYPKGFPGMSSADRLERINQRAAAIEDSLLKLMKAPPQPGTPPGAPVTPNKPTVATPGASGGGTPGGAAGAPGGAAKTAPQTNPQVQQPQANPSAGSAYTPTEHAKRPIQASMEIEDALLKLMKAPTDLTSQRRQAHMTNVGKTSQASREAGGAGQTLATRQDLNVQPGDTGAGEAHALASTAANLLGARSAQDFYSKLGQQSPQEFADTGGSRSRANPSIDGTDANVPPNPQPPAQQAAPQGAVNAGETATPTPDTNTPPPFKPQHIGANLLGGKKPS